MRTSKGRTKPIPVRIVHDEPSNRISPSQYKEPDRMHMSVRQIKNGYLVNRHGHKDGKHYDEEVYTPHCPNIDVPAAKGPQRSPSRNQRLGRTKI